MRKRQWLSPLFALAGAAASAMPAHAGDGLFPDGRLAAKTPNLQASVITEAGHLQGDAAWEKICQFVEKGGPDGANRVTVSVKREDLGERATGFSTGLIARLNGKPRKVVVSFSARSSDDGQATVTVGRAWGGSTTVTVNLSPEWAKREVELEATAEYPIDAVIFAPFRGGDAKTASFDIAGIDIREPAAPAMPAHAGDGLFPDGRLTAKTPNLQASVITEAGHLQGDAAWGKICQFVEKGGPDGANRVTVSVKREELGERATGFNTGLIARLDGKPRKVVVSFSARSGDNGQPTVTVGRAWGGSTTVTVNLSPEWTKREVELEATAEYPIDAVIFAPFRGGDVRTASFDIAGIDIRETAPPARAGESPGAAAPAMPAHAGDGLFPDGRLTAKTPNLQASVITEAGHLQGDAAWGKICQFVEKGGPDGANRVTVSVKREDLGERATGFNTGLIARLDGKPRKVVVSFSARSGDDGQPTVTVGRAWGGSTTVTVNLSPEWTKREVELEATAEYPIDAVIFAPFRGGDVRTASFDIAGIDIREPASPARASGILFGIDRVDAEQYNMEFILHDGRAAFYKEHGIQAALFNERMFTDPRHVPRLANELKKFHVVNWRSEGTRIPHLTPGIRDVAEKAGKALADYVRGGGGLILHCRPTHYPGETETEFQNIIFELFGARIMEEGVADPASLAEAEIKTGAKAFFSHTGAIDRHEVTEGVRGLWFPLNAIGRYAGTPYLRYSPDWTVVVRGEKTAGTFLVNANTNVLELDKPGTVDSAPPIVAVRRFGKGRIVSVAVNPLHIGLNLNKPSWAHRVEKGTEERPSDIMALMANAVKWAAAPALENAALGTYAPPTHKPIEFPASVVIAPNFLPDKKNRAKGVIGLRSDFTDGRNGVAEYAAAAKAAGLSFIAFADPLERLTAEKLEALKKACAEASSADFYASPGVEFTDGSGLRWILLGEKAVYPSTEPFTQGPHAYQLWDGKTIQHYGTYAMRCGLSPSAVVDYSTLRDNRVRPENLWWYFNVIPYAYKGGRLLADNYSDWKFALADLSQVVPLAYTRVASAAEIPAAAKASMQVVGSVEAAKNMLNSYGTWWHQAAAERPFVTYGGSVMIDNFSLVNYQIDPRGLRTRGVQRVPVRFAVSSENGIAQVKLLDSDRGAVRVFDGGGAKSFEREFELVLDKQRYVFLEAIDAKGDKAISNFIMIYDYKQGLYRCADNHNILGPLGIVWHSCWNELFPLVKDFRNAEIHSVHGWDRGGPDVPFPTGGLLNRVGIAGKGQYPPPFSFDGGDCIGAMRMRVQLAGGDMQIVDAAMDELSETYHSQRHPSAPAASPLRILGENEYFAHTQRMHSFRDRMDHHIAWDHRRLRESIRDYEGAAQYFEGEITFRRDATLDDSPGAALLLRTSLSAGAAALADDLVVIKDAERGLFLSEMKAGEKRNLVGMVAKDGFAALSSSPIGYIGIIPLKGDWGYNYHGGHLVMGVGRPGQAVKAGESLEYAFVSLNLMDGARDGTHLEMLRKVYAEGDYPLKIDAGERGPVGACFLNIKAEDHETLFAFGPKPGIGIDFPVRVDGIVDNGCAAVYTTVRPWFRYIGVMDHSESAFFQEPMDRENRVWAGNVFVADNPDLRFTLVVDGQKEGAAPFLEVHNPTSRPVKTTIRSPKNAPLFGGMAFDLTIPAGDSLFHKLERTAKENGSHENHDDRPRHSIVPL